MIAVAITAILAPMVLGALATTALLQRRESVVFSMPLLLGVGAGLGFAVTSTVFFFASLVSAHPARLDAAIEVFAALAIALHLWRRPKESRPLQVGNALHCQASFWILGLATLFTQACLAAFVVAFRTLEGQPFGGWDGWAIWNLHARLMFLGGEKWYGLLRSPQIVWSHPDYPMLLPASVARTWSFLGSDTSGAPAAISVFFGAATIWLLLASVARLKSCCASMIGGLVLLGTPFFVTFSSSQYADIPLGYFILATLVLLVLSERTPESRGLPALGGVFAGMAAWTKNEGWLFVVAIALVWIVARCHRGSFKSGVTFLGGLAIALIPVLFFKIAMAPPNDLVASRPLERLGYAFDGARHRLILAAIWHHGARFGEWSFAPFVALVLPLLGGTWRRLSHAERSVGAAILLILVGYYLVYLLSPKDLTWHIENSVDRLLLQLWPATVFLWCLRAFGESSPAPTRTGSAVGTAGRARTRLAPFAAFNLIAACVILSAFGHQLAPNELAEVRDSSGEIRAIAGTGWFQREEDSRDTWAWSRGTAALEIALLGRQETAPVTLRFRMRSLTDRIVEARIDGRILWSARIGKELSQVEIAIPMSNVRPTDIVFSTDEPSVFESTGSMARSLAFALYDLRLARKR